jgi:serine/threonine-protein kinase
MTTTPPSSTDLDPASVAAGAVLAGKYRVERILGEGGMGVVVLARHIDLDEQVALKFLRQEFAKHPEAAPRFLREARAAVKIKSAHVARVLDVGRLEGDAPFMVMEFLEGADLGAVLYESGVLPIADAVDYVIQATEALAEAHAYGIVHRDIKPSNLFLTRRLDGQPLVKVLDFGISKMLGGVEVLTRTTTVMGSTPYMSPEQMESTRDVDARTDVYALGATLYELVGGRTPFHADTTPQLCALVLKGLATPLRDLRPDIPPELEAVIRKAFALSRTDRYPSVAAFADALAPFAPPRSAEILAGIRRLASAAPGSMPAPASGVRDDAMVETVGLPSAPRSSAGHPSAPRGSAGVAPKSHVSSDGATITAPAPVVATSAGVSTTSSEGTTRPDRGGRRGLLAGAAVALIGGVGLVAFLHHGAADVPVAGAGGPAPTSSVEATKPNDAQTSQPAGTSTTGIHIKVQRVKVVVLPEDATVEIDGAKAEARDGVVEVVGPLGSVHRIRLTKDKNQFEGDVSVTEAGAMPPKLEMPVVAKTAPPPVTGKKKSPRFGFDE